LSDLAVLETDDVVAAREEVKSVSDEDSSLVSESSADRFVEQVLSDVSVDLCEEQYQLLIGEKGENTNVQLIEDRRGGRYRHRSKGFERC